jgi:RHS repeat-associated protein
MNKRAQIFLLLTLGCVVLAQPLFAQIGNDNPGGVTNEFNGSSYVAGQLDPYTGNARRDIDDIVVAGSIGAYPLKLTRTLSTRGVGGQNQFGNGGGWQHYYTSGMWILDDPNYCEDGHYCGPLGHLQYPGGGGVDFGYDISIDPVTYVYGMNGRHGPIDKLEKISAGHYVLWRGDGGKIVFLGTYVPNGMTLLYAYQIIDPYGQITTLDHDANGRLSRVTEPGGRYLEFFYQTTPNNLVMISMVTANDGRGNVIETVSYDYELVWLVTGNVYRPDYNLRTVHYDDNSQASYVYAASNMDYEANSITWQFDQVVHSCDDPRYAGPMKQIQYQYVQKYELPQDFVGRGLVKAEKNLLGQVVTQITYPTSWDYPHRNQRTETRGDGPSRSFSIGSAWTDFKGQPFTEGANPTAPGWTATDPRQNTTTYETEGIIGAVRKITHPGDNSTVEYTFSDPLNPYFHSAEKDENGYWTYFDRETSNPDVNKRGRVWRIRYPDGSTEEFTYNGLDQVLTHKLRSGGTETFTYDTRGLKQTHYPPATASDLSPEQHPTQYFYYESGANSDRLHHVVDPRGNYTWFEYNQRGQVTKTTFDVGMFTQSGYNADGTLAWTADENHPNASWNESERTRYIYDEYKRVRTVTNPLGETTTNSYEVGLAWLNPLLRTTNSPKTKVTPLGKHIIFDYDENVRKTSQVQGLGTADEAWTLFEYDEVGNLTKTTDPRWKITRFGYDSRNRQISITDALNQQTQIEYDGIGNKLKETRADNAFRSWEYDIPNRTTRAIDWRMSLGEPQVTTTKARDLPIIQNGQYVTIERTTDSKGAVYTFQFDALSRKTSATYPADATGVIRTETYTYDNAGNLKLYKNPGGNYKHMDYADSYDNRNRLRHSSWNNSATDLTANLSIGQEVTMNYDAANRITSIITNSGETTVAYGYDAANRKVTEDQTLAGYPTRQVKTPRDADGNRASLEVTGIYYIAYDYTGRNQLKSIGSFANFTYDPSGNLTNRTGVWLYTNGANFAYDDVNRVTMEEQGDATHVFTTTHYQYDSIGREVARWDHDTGKGDRFGYNAIGQLTSADYNGDQVWNGVALYPTDSLSYNMSPLNRQSVTRNGVTNNYISSAMNQYTNVGLTGLVYDTKFNLTGYGSQTTTFDAANRLISVTGSPSGGGGAHPISSVTKDGDGDSAVNRAGGGGETITGLGGGPSGSFVYDGLGRCVKRTINGVTRLFTYDDWKPMLEWDGSGNWVAWNIYGAGPDEILARNHATNGSLIYKQDHHGNVVALLSWPGVVEKYKYDAFGKPTVMNAAGTELSGTAYGNRFMFQGREYLSELGLYDYRHRTYHPGLGRFLQVDPLGFDAGDMNLFRYCGDDPVDRSDPTGLNWFYTNNKWEWHKGNTYTYKDADGKSHTLKSPYTGLLGANKTGIDKKTGATLYRITLYDQNKRVAEGSAFSGGNGHPATADGVYTIRLDIRDAKGPNSINPSSYLGNPPRYDGIQKMHDFGNYPAIDTYGPIRAMLNERPGGVAGQYFHGQGNGLGYTHGCLSYGTDARFVNHMWNNMGSTRVIVPVNVPFVEP